MKMKRGYLLMLILSLIILTAVLVIAQENKNEENEKAPLEKAYTCLEDKLGDDCGNTKNTEQTAFSLLAMADKSSIKSDCKSSLKDKEKDSCWGKTESASCDLKSTSLAILALNHIGTNVEDSIEYLLEKRKLTDELIWFLEIDANNATKCTIQSNGDEKIFNIREDKTITGSSSCLTPSEQDYFLRIRNTCLEKNFTISCDRDFITTLLYKKPESNVYHVSSQTHSAPAGDSTTEKVESYCFTLSDSCNYEGSLWAALALAKTGEDSSVYIPYISAMSDELINKKYLPSAFLYMLTNEDEYYLDLIEKQKQSKYWEESGNKLYDTALALLSLQSLNLEEIENTKNYLFEIQENSGCWANIANTAFILYALNPPKVISGNGGISRSDCEDPSYGYTCVSPAECSLSDILDNFYCPSLGDVCCRTAPEQLTCLEKNGIVCNANQQCTQPEVIAFDTNYCCLASCITIEKNECEKLGYSCKLECSDNEEEKTSYSDSCSGGVCCAEKEEKEGISWLWIIILLILIILVILAIIFRNRLKLWWFKFRNKVKTGKPPARPTPMIPTPFRAMPQKPLLKRRPISRTPRESKEKEFEETMRKLREMSK